MKSALSLTNSRKSIIRNKMILRVAALADILFSLIILLLVNINGKNTYDIYFLFELAHTSTGILLLMVTVIEEPLFYLMLACFTAIQVILDGASIFFHGKYILDCYTNQKSLDCMSDMFFEWIGILVLIALFFVTATSSFISGLLYHSINEEEPTKTKKEK